MIRSKLLPAAAALAVALGARGADAPPAPAPRAVAPAPAPAPDLERDAAVWAARAAQSDAMLRQAEAQLARAAAERKRADSLFERGAIAAADRDATHTQERLYRDAVTESARLARADQLKSEPLQEQVAFLRRRGGADATGTLAVDIVFPDAARFRVATAARDLVEGATSSTDGVPATAWDAARRGPHVLVRFPAPHRAVRVADAADIAAAEVLVPLPLTREPGGFVLVRDVGRVVRFTKYPPDASVLFQEALAAAIPAAR